VRLRNGWLTLYIHTYFTGDSLRGSSSTLRHGDAAILRCMRAGILPRMALSASCLTPTPGFRSRVTTNYSPATYRWTLQPATGAIYTRTHRGTNLPLSDHVSLLLLLLFPFRASAPFGFPCRASSDWRPVWGNHVWTAPSATSRGEGTVAPEIKRSNKKQKFLEPILEPEEISRLPAVNDFFAKWETH
jgi:hypothetical protein